MEVFGNAVEIPNTLMFVTRTPKRWQLTEEIPRRMPILDRWLERVAQDRPLTGVTVLMIQHQLGNQVPQTQALREAAGALGGAILQLQHG